MRKFSPDRYPDEQNEVTKQHNEGIKTTQPIFSILRQTYQTDNWLTKRPIRTRSAMKVEYIKCFRFSFLCGGGDEFGIDK